MPVLITEGYYKIYYTKWCSFSTLYCLIMIIFTVIFPFFIAMASDSNKYTYY